MIVCSICGSTHVKCVAVVNPNTKEFIGFGYEAFLDGECNNCGNVALTDSEEVQTDIDKLWDEHLTRFGTTPKYVYCDIVRLDYEGTEHGYIRIGETKTPEPAGKVIAACCNLNELKALAVPNPDRKFTIIEVCAMLLSLYK